MIHWSKNKSFTAISAAISGTIKKLPPTHIFFLCFLSNMMAERAVNT